MNYTTPKQKSKSPQFLQERKKDMNFSKYVPIPTTLLDVRGCTRRRQKVYNCLILRSHNGKRQAYGGRVSIAKQLCIAQSTVQEALDWLESAGVIVKTFQSIGGRGIANAFRVIIAGQRAVRTLVSLLSSKLTDSAVTKKTTHITNEGKIKNIVGNSPNSPPNPRIQHIRALRNQIQNM